MRRFSPAFANKLAVHLAKITTYRLKNNAKRQRKYSVRPINRHRTSRGQHALLYSDLRSMDPKGFFEHFRMSIERFDILLSLVRPKLERKSTARCPILPDERLAFTLEVLAHGPSVRYAARKYRIGESTGRKILYETCQAIWDTLAQTYVKPPDCEEFVSIAKDFWINWNFPHCLGAVDGKLVNIQCPPGTGSTYFGYKGRFAVILMACVDASYKFMMLDVGGYGKQGDPQTFSCSNFGKKIINRTLPVPPDCPLPGSDVLCPHVFVGDEAFQLLPNFMHPYPGSQLTPDEPSRSIFNYRSVLIICLIFLFILQCFVKM